MKISKLENTKGELLLDSSLNTVLDMFNQYSLSSYDSKYKVEYLQNLIKEAYAENPLLAVKTLFHIRDVREGQGVREAFKIGLKQLVKLDSELLYYIIPLVGEYGRYDDLLVLLGTEVESDVADYIKTQLEKDMFISKVITELKEKYDGKETLYIVKTSKYLQSLIKDEDFKLDLENIDLDMIVESEKLEDTSDSVSLTLLGKWLPSINASSKNKQYKARQLARAIGYSKKEYQNACSLVRKNLNLIETKLSEKNYDIEYKEVPSKAFVKYNNAFLRHDKVGYDKFMEKVDSGEVELKVSSLYPHEVIVKSELTKEMYYSYRKNYMLEYKDAEHEKLVEGLWKQMSKEVGEKIPEGSNFLPILDTSGSMHTSVNESTTVLDVALGLSLLMAENSKGTFANKIIPFSAKANMLDISGETLLERINIIFKDKDFGSTSTNLYSAFEKVLEVAKEQNVSKEDMPKTLVVVTDMEFDMGWYSGDSYHYGNFEVGNKKVAKLRKMFEDSGYDLPQLVFWNVLSTQSLYQVDANTENTSLVSGYANSNVDAILTGEIQTPIETLYSILSKPRYDKVEEAYNKFFLA